MADCVYINGRFLSARLSGVQRVAYEIIRALDRQLVLRKSIGLPSVNIEILHPPGAKSMPDLKVIASRQVGQRRGQAWEQIDLPIASRSGTLVSLCNAAPIFKRNAFTMLHDAQVHTAPGSYSRSFRIWYKIIHPLIGRLHRRILTVSEFSKGELAGLGIAASNKITCIPNGCDHVLHAASDPGAIAKFGLEHGNFTVSLANTQPHKNIAVLLQAFADPRLAGHVLALFGSASAADFTKLGMSIPGNVRFLGRISDEELKGLLEGATAFACPSLTEGFGLMPLEAMALGCPAIVAPCGALPEVCGDAAMTADPHSAKQWADQIVRLTADQEVVELFRRKGRERAAFFSWERSAGTLLELLTQNAMKRTVQ